MANDARVLEVYDLPLRVQRAIVLGPVPEHRPDLGPCWLWTGRTKGEEKGEPYGIVTIGGGSVTVHTLVWLLVHGDVPEIADRRMLDHLCRVRLCCNWRHLEDVSAQENVLRGDTIPARHAAKTHCPAGHPFDEANTHRYKGRRVCRKCRTAGTQRWRDNHPAEWKQIRDQASAEYRARIKENSIGQ